MFILIYEKIIKIIGIICYQSDGKKACYWKYSIVPVVISMVSIPAIITSFFLDEMLLVVTEENIYTLRDVRCIFGAIGLLWLVFGFCNKQKMQYKLLHVLVYLYCIYLYFSEIYNNGLTYMFKCVCSFLVVVLLFLFPIQNIVKNFHLQEATGALYSMLISLSLTLILLAYVLAACQSTHIWGHLITAIMIIIWVGALYYQLSVNFQLDFTDLKVSDCVYIVAILGLAQKIISFLHEFKKDIEEECRGYVNEIEEKILQECELLCVYFEELRSKHGMGYIIENAKNDETLQCVCGLAIFYMYFVFGSVILVEQSLPIYMDFF